MPEKDNERKKIAKIICSVVKKVKCKNCDYRCIAYEIADTLVNLGCSITQERIEK